MGLTMAAKDATSTFSPGMRMQKISISRMVH